MAATNQLFTLLPAPSPAPKSSVDRGEGLEITLWQEMEWQKLEGRFEKIMIWCKKQMILYQNDTRKL